MPVKSIIEVDVNDEAFRTFHALFLKYKEQAKELPGAWAEVDKTVGSVAGSFGDMVSAMMAQATLAEALEKRRKRAIDDEKKQVVNWKSIAVSTKDAAKNIGAATLSLAKWLGFTGAISGLLGAGGLYGIDRLAFSAASGRRSSLGLGTTYGQEKAFETDFGRLVDAQPFLGGVAEALHDVTKKWTLLAAGADEGAIATGDAGAVGASLLSSVKKLVDRTPPEQLQQLSDARGLGQFFSLQDLIRLRATKPEELAAQTAAYRRDAAAGFGLSDATLRKWQDFSTQLDRAGRKIETVLIDGLTPLAKPLSDLSDSVANAVGEFVKSIKPSDIKAIGDDITEFGKYLASPEFRKDVRDFGADLSSLGKAIADFLHLFNKKSAKEVAESTGLGAIAGGAIGGLVAGPGGVITGAKIGALVTGAATAYDIAHGNKLDDTNPLNLRDPRKGYGWQHFGSRDEGIQAAADQLLRYEYADKGGPAGKGWSHLDTIAKIIATFAPAKDHNNVPAYIKEVEGTSGIDRNAHLDLHNKETLARVLSAMAKVENRKKNKDITPNAVIRVLNQTGGSAVVQTSQAAGQ